LTEASFAPYGGIIAAGLKIPPTVTGLGGASQRSVEVVKPENRYEKAPSGKAGREVVNVSVAIPRQLKEDEKGGRRYVMDLMERHPFTTQIFVPMSRDAEYLVVVANTKDDKPDLDSLKAFVAREGQGICYRTGVFHAPMSVAGLVPVTFAIFQHSNGVQDEDCEFFPLSEPEMVEICL